MRGGPVLLLGALVGLAGCGGGGVSQSEQQKAIAEAKQALAQAHLTAPEAAAGPCIAERLPGLDDWVVDIAHDPRQPVDDDPTNQCQRYLSGQAHHFVELTPDGQVIRAQ